MKIEAPAAVAFGIGPEPGAGSLDRSIERVRVDAACIRADARARLAPAAGDWPAVVDDRVVEIQQDSMRQAHGHGHGFVKTACD